MEHENDSDDENKSEDEFDIVPDEAMLTSEDPNTQTRQPLIQQTTFKDMTAGLLTSVTQGNKAK